MNDTLNKYLRQYLAIDELSLAQLSSKPRSITGALRTSNPPATPHIINDPTKILKNLLDYLDQQISVISEFIYPSQFNKFLKMIWEILLNVRKTMKKNILDFVHQFGNKKLTKKIF